MFKKSILFLAVLFLVASIFTVYEKRAEANDTKGDETYFNKKGLSYFNHGFYKLTPKGRQDEASPYYESAIIEFKKAIEINESFLQAHLNLARVYFVQKEYDQAAAAYQEALDLDPGNIETAANLANCFFLMGEREQAREVLTAARDRVTDPDLRDRLDAFIAKIRVDR